MSDRVSGLEEFGAVFNVAFDIVLLVREGLIENDLLLAKQNITTTQGDLYRLCGHESMTLPRLIIGTS